MRMYEHIETKLDQLLECTARLDKQQVELITEMNHLKPMIEEHQRVIRGNNGNAGLVEMIRRCEKNDKLLHGDGLKPGLVDDVRNYRSTRASVRRFAWVLVSTTLGGAISALIAIFLTH
jgi:hypothetical protein